MLNIILAYVHILAALLTCETVQQTSTHWQWLHRHIQQPVVPTKQRLSHHYINAEAGCQPKLIQPQEPSNIAI
jgi:hypothetical protein